MLQIVPVHHLANLLILLLYKRIWCYSISATLQVVDTVDTQLTCTRIHSKETMLGCAPSL
ncbi:hypothetical protein M758_7G111100 [Ceratodon purpureus]|uniref:Uncharacterized protein n=1 Tax=Ceratodon purpureus TaxID=3225 RepID=A0A8T0HAG6_CERPU|nr:hypothetical protein KC19_7G165300 [Ceratodon purpureus]KAG0611054.1 hypothetical protein M758_7G111100 [Ceratodon purpureus]